MASWDPVPANVPAARRFVVSTLQTWNSAVDRDAAALIVSELTSNAVLHACSGFDVTLDDVPSGLVLRVRDGSPTLPVRRPPSPTAPGGLGLRLLDELCSSWGTIDDGAGGKVVWAALQSDGRGAATGGGS
jgi:hypothetical protein